MKRAMCFVTILILSVMLGSCACLPPDRYNTQRGALVGAGAGALIGQAIGHNTAGTLIGLAAGTIFGALVGNAVDQDYQAARDAARYEKPVIYYDRKGGAVEAVPGPVDPKSHCRKVTKRTWQDGKLLRETIEEVCQEPEVVVREYHYEYPAYPRVYLYHHFGWPHPYYYGPRWHGAYRWGPRHHW